MQIVLAIHGDRRQTEQIAALLNKRAAVEVVQASDAGEGLQEIGDRIPDLILTSPLLSPFDEGVLAEYLRELGSAAAHVQTLRIPVLNMPEASGGGFFSRKKKRVEATLAGCDPAHFVEEITQYLARAAEERKTTAPASWGTPAVEPPAHSSISNDVSEPYPMASSESSSYHPVSPSYSTSPVADDNDRGATESAFPTYKGPYSFDEPPTAGPQPSAATYGADVGRVPEDVAPVYQAPVYQPLDAIQDRPPVEATPTYQGPVEAATPIYQPPVETPTPFYQPFDSAEGKPFDYAQDKPLDVTRSESLDSVRDDESAAHGNTHATVRATPERRSFLDRLGPAISRYERVAESTPIHQPPPAAEASVYSPLVEPVVHVFEPPAQQPPPVVADSPDVTIEPQAHAHASLVLDPSQPEPVAADPPFVVHSTEDRIPLAESLERAAAELEASSLGEPMPARETERVPMHRLSSIEEIPLPEELAARVERTAALHRSLTPDTAAWAPQTAPTPSANTDARERARVETTSGSGSLLASPLDIEAPVRPKPIAEPVAPIAAGPAAPLHASETTPEAEKPATQKRTPSFEAALAAIRKAWGRPKRGATANLASPLSLNLNRLAEEPVASPEPTTAPAQTAPESLTVPAPPVEAVAASPATPALEAALTIESDSSTREVDLTLDIEALDDHGSVTVVEATAPEQVQIIPHPLEEDVYELSASPALHDLEADLAAAGPPPPVREMFPPSFAERHEERANVEPATSAPRKRDKHRKKSDKRKPLKAQKASAQPPTPQTPPGPPEPPEPAQDEWGLFDPNRCGFAALVDKLNEVTDEKERQQQQQQQQKPTKTTVRVISYG